MSRRCPTECARRTCQVLVLLLLLIPALGPVPAAGAPVAPEGVRVSTSDAPGVLSLSVSGLPAGVMGRISVTGTHGYRRMLGATGDLAGLSPGTYSIRAKEFMTTDGTFRPSRRVSKARVTAGQVTRLAIEYVQVAPGSHPVPPVAPDAAAPPMVAGFPFRATYGAWSDFDPLTGTVSIHSQFPDESNAAADWLDPSPVVFQTQVASGIYEASLPSGAVAPVVVSTSPYVQRSSIAVIVPDFTWQAYNEAGGWSFYVPEGNRPVSINRPLRGIKEYNAPSYNPIAWLEQRYGQVDVIAQSDLHYLASAYDLSRYRLVVLYGHDEYWSKELRTEVESAVSSGTNLLNMSGNTMWFHLEVTGSIINRSTYWAWYLDLRELPEEHLTGVSYRFAGYPYRRALEGRPFTASDYQTLLARGFPPEIPFDQALRYTDGFRVVDHKSPLMKGTGLHNGDWFGVDSQLAYMEVDGFPMTPDGAPDSVLMTGHVPKSLRMVAEVYAWQGHAATVVRKGFGKGKVVSLGSIGWVRSLLAGDKDVVKITENAMGLLK